MFTPSDIVVGQKYRNVHHRGTVYLGVGMTDLKTKQFVNKGLVIISTGLKGYLYQLPQDPPTEQDIKNWQGFRLTSQIPL